MPANCIDLARIFARIVGAACAGQYSAAPTIFANLHHDLNANSAACDCILINANSAVPTIFANLHHDLNANCPPPQFLKICITISTQTALPPQLLQICITISTQTARLHNFCKSASRSQRKQPASTIFANLHHDLNANSAAPTTFANLHHDLNANSPPPQFVQICITISTQTARPQIFCKSASRSQRKQPAPRIFANLHHDLNANSPLVTAF